MLFINFPQVRTNQFAIEDLDAARRPVAREDEFLKCSIYGNLRKVRMSMSEVLDDGSTY
jgi:hypothetical protein